MTDEIPETGAVFTFGKSHFADNEPSHFFIKNDPIVAISCGDEHSAVICQNGRVFVFGGNAWGQLGLGHKDEVTRPSCVKWLKPHRATFVACGRAHTIFVTDTNTIYAVGCNDEGQLGTGDMEHHTVPQYVELDGEQPSIKQVSAGSNHTALLTDEGRVFVCGSNSEGQLGLGEDTRSCVKFTELKFMEKIAFVECGYYNTVFITTQGAVFVTGDNENQKLGIPNTATTIYNPEVLPIDIPIKSACCGACHTFLLSMDESKILAFGSNEKGQLGMPKDIENVTEPTEIDMDKMFDGYQLKLVACGAMHTAFVTDNGLFYTCGESRHNKLCLEEIDDADNSNEATPNQYSPKRVTAMNGYVVDNVACGGCHTLLTATKGSNSDFTNNDFNIVNEENRQISLTELPPLQKIPGMNKLEELPHSVEKVTNANTDEHPTADNVNGNVHEDTGSIDSLEANVSGSHIVNINDLENENGSMHDISDINKDEIDLIPIGKAEVMEVIKTMDTMVENTADKIQDTAKENVDKMVENASQNIESTAKEANKIHESVKENVNKMVENTSQKIEDTAKEADKIHDIAKENVNKMVENVSEKIQDTVKEADKIQDTVKESVNTMSERATDKIQNTMKNVTDNISGKMNEKVEVVEEFFKKTGVLDPRIHHEEKKVLEVPDKIAETANSPPPKTPIIQELLSVPDITQLSPNLSKHSDDGQKSETGQSENETIPCGSDKSSPQAGKTAKTQAVMPILRGDDIIDSHDAPENNEESDVVVNKLPEKGRFARIFQNIRDKENSCMGKGKVIEEKVVENVHKGVDGAEDTVHKIEETVETEIRNQTNSRTCTIL